MKTIASAIVTSSLIAATCAMIITDHTVPAILVCLCFCILVMIADMAKDK